MSAVQSICRSCLKIDDNLKTCGQCHLTSYCSAACQAQDWPKHKLYCQAGPKPAMDLKDQVTSWYGLPETKGEIAVHADKAPKGEHMVYSVTDWKEKKVEVLYVSLDQLKGLASASVDPAVLEIPNLEEKLLVMVLVPETEFGIFLWRFRENHDRKFFELEFRNWCRRIPLFASRGKHLLVTIQDWAQRKYTTEEAPLERFSQMLSLEEVQETDVVIGVAVPEKGYEVAFRFVKQ